MIVVQKTNRKTPEPNFDVPSIEIKKSNQLPGPKKPGTPKGAPEEPEVRYMANTEFEFFFELREVILKSSPAEKEDMIIKINRLGKVKAAIISGIFLKRQNPDPDSADLLIVGDDINRRKLSNFLKALEAEVGKEIKYAVMDKDEFKYRLSMFDRFVRLMMEGPHEMLINKLGI